MNEIYTWKIPTCTSTAMHDIPASKILMPSYSLSPSLSLPLLPDQSSYHWGSYRRGLLVHRGQHPPVRGCRSKDNCRHCSPTHLRPCLHHTHHRGCRNRGPSGGYFERWHSCRKHRQIHLCRNHVGRGCAHTHSCPVERRYWEIERRCNECQNFVQGLLWDNRIHNFFYRLKIFNDKIFAYCYMCMHGEVDYII